MPSQQSRVLGLVPDASPLAWVGYLTCMLCRFVWAAIRAECPENFVKCPRCGKVAGHCDI